MATVPARNTALVAICESFAQGLVNTPEYEEWRAARAAREGDAEVAALTADVKRLGADLRLAQGRRDPVAASLEQRYAAAQTRLQTHPAAVRQQAAARTLIEMLRDANTLLSGSLGVDFAATAAPPRQGGCCG
jgi:formate-dependent nitrite reductase cytochrome c552 subunit